MALPTGIRQIFHGISAAWVQRNTLKFTWYGHLQFVGSSLACWKCTRENKMKRTYVAAVRNINLRPGLVMVGSATFSQ